MKEQNALSPCAAALSEIDPQRRIMLKIAGISAAGGCALPLGIAHANDAPAADGVQRGDLLVPAKGDSSAPVKLDDLKVGTKPLLVFPFDPQAQKPRSESRLNKLLLVRVDEAELSDELRPRAVQGVLAFSAICTHQACDVTEWVAAEKQLMCFCHFSKFSPQDGSVTKGPASKSLPWVPLAQKDGVLMVAGAFSAKPGV